MKRFFSKNLRFLREVRDLSQEELAIEIGKKRSTIGSYETGLAEPTLDGFEEIAKFFGVDVNTLIYVDLSSQGGPAAKESQPKTIRGSAPGIYKHLVKENHYLKKENEHLRSQNNKLVEQNGELLKKVDR